MIEKIKNEIEELRQNIEDNEIDMKQFFGLLETINKQVAEVQKNIELLQLEKQKYIKEIERLQIVKTYLEELEEKKGEKENEQ